MEVKDNANHVAGYRPHHWRIRFSEYWLAVDFSTHPDCCKSLLSSIYFDIASLT
jgi:hypothetical protein